MCIMKKALFFTLLVAMIGCKPVEPMFEQEAFILNYAEIAGPNFLITESDAVSFDYIGVASLYVVKYTGNMKIDKVKNKKYSNNEIYGGNGQVEYQFKTSGLREASTRSALNYAVEKAKELGGDGIIRLRTNTHWDVNKKRMDHVEITGMIIKRK